MGTIRSFGDWELVLFDVSTGEKAYVNKVTGEMCEDPPTKVLEIIRAENAQKRLPVYEPTSFRFGPLPDPVGEADEVCILCLGAGEIICHSSCPLCDGTGLQDPEAAAAKPAPFCLRPISQEFLPSFKQREAFVLRNLLMPEECADIIRQAKEFGLSSCGYSRKIRITDRVSVMGEALGATLFKRARPFLEHVEVAVGSEPTPEGVRSGLKPGCWVPMSLNPCFRVCKYEPGGFFLPHFDGGFDVSNDYRSIMTFMMYLNDDFEGGPTSFYEDTQRHYTQPDPSKVRYELQPELGSCIVFNHAICHDGGKLMKGQKWLLRTEVMYQWVGRHSTKKLPKHPPGEQRVLLRETVAL